MSTLKPLIVAVVLSLLIHSGLFAVIAAKSYFRHQTEAAPLPIGTNSSRVQFLATSGDGDNEGRVTDNKDAQPQIEQEQASPSLAGVSETPLPASDAPIGLLTANLEINRDESASPAFPGGATGTVVEGEVGTAQDTGGPAGGGIGGAGGNAAYARNPLPPYPREARERRWQGTTLLRVQVLADGTVGKIEVAESSDHPILDDVSVQTVRDWKFLPARSGNTPILSIAEIPITFRMLE